jgi:hypothetical protein
VEDDGGRGRRHVSEAVGMRVDLNLRAGGVERLGEAREEYFWILCKFLAGSKFYCANLCTESQSSENCSSV